MLSNLPNLYKKYDRQINFEINCTSYIIIFFSKNVILQNISELNILGSEGNSHHILYLSYLDNFV
jgi:hypothetical protein